jgi:hypothetical protein
MPQFEMSRLSNDARVWVFGASPSLGPAASRRLLAAVDEFLSGWTAHNVPVISGRELIDGTFLVIAAERNSETSGCSIDRLFNTLQRLEADLRVNLVDTERIFYRDPGGAIRTASRAEFRSLAEQHEVHAGTRVFDPLVETVGAIRRGELEKPAASSWHGRAFAISS